MYNNYKDFYAYIMRSPKTSDSPEIINILKDDPENVDFYNLCQNYLNIALNALKINDKETNKLAGVFQFTDIDRAAEETRYFIEKHSICDVHLMLDMIFNRYKYCKSSIDQRPSAVFVPSDEVNLHPISFEGVYYPTFHIPPEVWVDIKKDILSKLS